MKKFLTVFTLLVVNSFCNAQSIIDVKTASNNVIVVYLETDWINIRETNRITNYENIKPSTEGWLVNSISPVDIGIHSKVWDQHQSIRLDGYKQFPQKFRHRIFLMLNEALAENTTYHITSPYGNTSFIFKEGETYCESIKVNQVGYALNSTTRHANFGVFMGDKGSVELSSLPTYQVRDSASGQMVHTGTLTYWGDDTGSGREQSGEHVYQMDLAPLAEGAYYITIDGIGRSYYFGVGIKYSRRIASTHLRGMYHQRCGIALEEPHTNYTRGVCHEEVAFTKYEGNGREGEGWITVPDGSEMQRVIGGYHDAGDYDRRVYHTIIPLLMLNYFEAFQNHFIDNQYNIPESGNGMPDFLDEALWGVKVWEYLQLDESNSEDPTEWGGVMGGTESSRHPTYGVHRADLEWQNARYGTYAVYESTTLASVGFFAQASRLLKNYDKERSDKFLERALLAWDYSERNAYQTRVGFRLYAALQLYLATATGSSTEDMANEYHVVFRELAQNHITEGGQWPYQYKPGNVAADITTSHFIGYLINDVTKDDNLAENLKLEIKKGADTGGYMGWLPGKYPYPQGATKFIGWGAATAQGIYADPAAYMYRLSESDEDKQKYFDIVSQYGDYSLGLNPLSKSYVTGLGKNQVQCPLHLDSYWTKFGETPQGGTQPVLGNVPGIVIYGFTEGRSGAGYQKAVSDFLYPAWDDLPGQRRWTDGWSLVNSNEFTTWETMVWNTCMYAVLYSAPSDPNVDTPSSNVSRVTLNPNDSKLRIYPNPATDHITISGYSGTGRGKCMIYSISGRVIHTQDVLMRDGGEITITGLQPLCHGTYIVKIITPDYSYSGKFIK